jgi:glycosyltransferase involved in cell wall biosynthesis
MPISWLKKKYKKTSKFPLVSVLTPTYNRRPFIPWSIKCMKNQDYPKSRIEWIILDDGSDSIEDLVKDIPFIKYHRYEEKMNIGKKRNILNKLATGDYIVAWDDDDFYPPGRLSHSVETLVRNPKATIAGASECYMWYSDIKKIYKVGPYGENHGTNGTMAYTKGYKERHIYDEYVLNAEEGSFTGGFKETMAQLNPKHVILVTSHSMNTFDKRSLRGGNKLIQPTDQKISDWIKDKELLMFFENVWEHLKNIKQLGDAADDDDDDDDDDGDDDDDDDDKIIPRPRLMAESEPEKDTSDYETENIRETL